MDPKTNRNLQFYILFFSLIIIFIFFNPAHSKCVPRNSSSHTAPNPSVKLPPIQSPSPVLSPSPIQSQIRSTGSSMGDANVKLTDSVTRTRPPQQSSPTTTSPTSSPSAPTSSPSAPTQTPRNSSPSSSPTSSPSAPTQTPQNSSPSTSPSAPTQTPQNPSPSTSSPSAPTLTPHNSSPSTLSLDSLSTNSPDAVVTDSPDAVVTDSPDAVVTDSPDAGVPKESSPTQDTNENPDDILSAKQTTGLPFPPHSVLFPSISKLTKPDPAVEKICEQTDYPDLCRASISPFFNGKSDVISLLEISIKACAQYTKVAMAAAKQLVNAPITPKATATALGDCTDMYSDALDNLQSAINAMATRDIGTINTMLSAAISDFSTCEDQFEGQGSLLASYDSKLSDMASNCLAVASLIVK